MVHLIDKDALVSEIEKLMKRYDSEYDKDSTEVKAAKGNLCHEILCTIDSLEVKEVDLMKEIKKVQRKYKIIEEYQGYPCTMYADDIEWIAKHFFELGLKAQIMTSKLQQRISVLKMEFWTGLQTFEETEMTLSDAYNQGVDDILEELGINTERRK